MLRADRWQLKADGCSQIKDEKPRQISRLGRSGDTG